MKKKVLSLVLTAAMMTTMLAGCGSSDNGSTAASTGEDTQEIMEKMVDKLLRLRIFSDENDKINLSLSDVGGSLLLVSQFTLYADCRKGNRPSFVHAAPPAQAEALYESCKAYCRERVPVVESGIFGADMQVELCNDGPFTVMLDSDEIIKR